MKAYQLKITIKDSKPPIWRRCIIPSGITFSQLSILINEIMGWSGYHLFNFEFYHSQIRVEEETEDSNCFGSFDGYDVAEASTSYINEYMENEEWFTYTYDFGDDWEHRVTIEKVIPDYEYNYPQVLKYKGNCPMEDSGGIYGYYETMEILQNPTDPEYEERKEWFDISCYEEYDQEDVNICLKEDYVITYGKGEKRRQSEIYEARLNGETGMTASKTAKNRTTPLQSSKHKADDALKRVADLFKQSLGRQDYVTDLGTYRKEKSLKDIYEFYNKKDILEIAKRCGVSSYYDYNKADLITHTVEVILEKTKMESYFLCLRDYEIEEFESAICCDSIYPVKNIMAFDRILEGGYCGLTDDEHIAVPMDVAQAYKRFDSEEFHIHRRKRSFLQDCITAACFLYGIAPISIIVKMYNKEAEYGLNETELLAECKELPTLYDEFVILDGFVIDKELMKGEDYKNLQECQGNKEFYYPSRGEIKDLAELRYLPSEKSLQKLIAFLIRRIGVEMGKAEQIGAVIQSNIIYGCKMQDLFSLLDKNNIHINSDKELQELVSLLNELWNDTRMVINRGFKPLELANMVKKEMKPLSNLSGGTKRNNNVINFPVAKKDKIYPNDSCPCNSGKKYKQCCGKVKD